MDVAQTPEIRKMLAHCNFRFNGFLTLKDMDVSSLYKLCLHCVAEDLEHISELKVPGKFRGAFRR